MPKFILKEDSTPKPAMVDTYGENLAKLLCIRGINDTASAQAFLNPSPNQFNDPLALYGAAQALELIRQAKRQGQRVVVWGDYDTDGICACSILTLALRRFGLQVNTYTPLRQEGYGLNLPSLEKIRSHCDLLITVDLGITNHEEVRYAQKLGMTVIVTDHHTPDDKPSPADVVVHPALGNYPCKKLCGTGVAFKLAQGLLGIKQSMDLLDLAAIGTIADLVPLTQENRVIAALGLPVISSRKRPGIRAMLKVLELEGEVHSDTVAYQLAPRLNASGRMGDAGEGVRLMLTHSDSEAEEIAQKLEEWNLQRRKYEDIVIQDCEEQISGADMIRDWGLILRGEGWSSGVVGLAAGRITNKYSCPSCVLTGSGENQLTGSLRSVPGINIHSCLTHCDDLLLHWGGHEAAAGVTLSSNKYESFRQRLMGEIMKADPACFLPRREYELAVHISELNEWLMRDIDRLAPFGLGNPVPTLAVFGARLHSRRAVGAEGRHLKLTLGEGEAYIDGIAFQMGDRAEALPDKVDVIFQLGRNTFRGVTRLQVIVSELEPEAGAVLRKVQAFTTEEVLMALLRYMKDAADTDPGDSPGEARVFYENPTAARESLVSALAIPERGHLLVCHTPKTASQWLRSCPSLLYGENFNPQHFPRLLRCPEQLPREGDWRQIWLLDGMVGAQELQAWLRLFPKAVVHVLPRSPELRSLAAQVQTSREDWAAVYRGIRTREAASFAQFAKICGMNESRLWATLTVLKEAGLIRFEEKPFYKEILACSGKVNPEELSELWKGIRELGNG